jgi:hypothetical protein
LRPAVHQLIFYVLDTDRTRQYSISLHALQSYPCHELDWTIKKYISPERVKRIDEMPQCADGDRCICPNAPLQGSGKRLPRNFMNLINPSVKLEHNWSKLREIYKGLMKS